MYGDFATETLFNTAACNIAVPEPDQKGRGPPDGPYCDDKVAEKTGWCEDAGVPEYLMEGCIQECCSGDSPKSWSSPQRLHTRSTKNMPFFLGMFGTVTLRLLLGELIPALYWKATDFCFPTRRRSQSSEQYSR